MSFRTPQLVRAGALAAILALGACAGPGSAMNDFNPEEVRVITPTEATSQCIGDPRTPVCAVETLRACFARLDKTLCEKTGIRSEILQFPENPHVDRYRILSARVIRKEDITPKLRDAEWYKPGFIEVTIHDMDVKRYYCPERCLTGYMIKSELHSWKVMDWAAWGFEDFGE